MKKVVGNLLKNKNVDQSLKEYYRRFMEINNKYAMIHLAMNYYTYYIAAKEEGMITPGYKNAIDVVNNTISDLFGKGITSEHVDTLEKVREDIIDKVSAITYYVDKYNIYEYALNRVEYRFRDFDMPVDYTDEGFTKIIMQFILEDEDNMLINAKIQDVIGQLPVRLTKGKFFELLSNGLSMYKGGTKESLNNFIYMIKTASMLGDSDKAMEKYPFLQDAFDSLAGVNFKEIDEQQYNEMKDIMNNIARDVDGETDACMMIEAIVNDLMIILYTNDYKTSDKTTEVCDEIIKDTNLLFEEKISPKTDKEIEDMFFMLEGKQEEIYPKLASYGITDRIRQSYMSDIDRLNLSAEYDAIFKITKLNTDSLFAKYDDLDDSETVDDKYIELQSRKLIDLYTEIFKNNERMVNRAVMSAVLSELPVFFSDISELQDYIYNALSACTDKAEKIGCVEIINGIMAE